MDSKKATLVAYAGAALAVVCFFLPWISISFFGASFSVTGQTIASGGGSDMASLGETFAGGSFLYLFPVVGVLAALAVAMGKEKLGSKNTSMAVMVMGLVAVAYWLYLMFAWNGEFSKTMQDAAAYGFDMSFWSILGLGFWGTGVGSVLLAVAGFLMMGKKPSQQTVPEAPAETV